MKFRRKPIVVEADQWWGHGKGDGSHPKVALVPDRFEGRCTQLKKFGWLETSMGGHLVKAGDWIIKNPNGEYSSCNPITFERLYEYDDRFEDELPKRKSRDRSA